VVAVLLVADETAVPGKTADASTSPTLAVANRIIESPLAPT
jgi:hypothetical protein